jgi:hypothetical protein
MVSGELKQEAAKMGKVVGHFPLISPFALFNSTLSAATIPESHAWAF